MKPQSTPESEDAVSAEDRRLQALLREHGTDYIDDAGFTASVLGRLPPARKTRSRRRIWLVSLAAAVGGTAAVVGTWNDLGGGAELWRLACAWSARPLPYCGDVLSFGSLLVLAASLAVGWRAYARES